MESKIDSDITTSSHDKLAENPVKFQGTEFVFNEIIPAESPLAKLLGKKNETEICDPMPILNAHN